MLKKFKRKCKHDEERSRKKNIYICSATSRNVQLENRIHIH